MAVRVDLQDLHFPIVNKLSANPALVPLYTRHDSIVSLADFPLRAIAGNPSVGLDCGIQPFPYKMCQVSISQF